MEEYTIAALQELMAAGQLTAAGLTRRYLERIAQIDRSGPALNAVIELNPDALPIAQALDDERLAGKVRGPLHGIPILLKDNIDTHDRMQTAAGSLALAGTIAPRDAFLVGRLRKAGAIILGKTNLSEWANFRGARSTSGWSSRGGLTRNPYALDRNACGSSTGSAVAVAADLCAAAVGTETDGSIICPAQTNGIVGIKPTLGLVSRSGIIPIAHSQDTAGPMARCMADAAALLGALAGADPRDRATRAAGRHVVRNYARFLDPDGLRGARIGVVRALPGLDERTGKIYEACVATLAGLGATIVDPADIATADKLSPTELEVLLFEFKAGLNAYLAARGADTPVKSLADVIAFNEANKERVMPYFGQERMRDAQKRGSLKSGKYLSALAKDRRLARAEGIDATLRKHRLDAIVSPSGGPAWMTDLVNGDSYSGVDSTSPAAVAGYPHITVPAGYVFGLPVGLSFIGRAWSEPELIKFAFAFEQATLVRKPPQFLPTVTLDG